jgi:hypothetical protein
MEDPAMTVVDEAKTSERQLGYCPQCGHQVTVEHYCPECGHALDAPTSMTEPELEATRVIPPRPAGAAPAGVPPTGDRQRSRALMIGIPVALVIAAAAAVAIIVISNSGSGQSNPPSYQQRLASALAPVMTANRNLSAALQSLDGSRKTIVASQNATSQAQSAVAGAQGAITVISAPTSGTALSQQVQQALTDENGYLQAVSSTLASPSSQSASQLQTLVTSTQSALIPLAPVAPGASSSLSGTGNLVSWVTGANHAQKQAQAAQAKSPGANSQQGQASAPATSSSQPPSSSPSGLTPCDQNISVNSNTSCPFANNVFNQYAIATQSAGAPGSYAVFAFSPNTGQSFTDNCNYNATNQIVLCSHGSDLVQFPYWAAQVYQTH